MRILARIQNMASSEILTYIPKSVLAEIKKEDPRPEFRAYVIGHEGQSEGHIVGEGPLVARWFASAIRKIHEKLQLGLKIFHGHAETNEHSGRTPIGELVGKALKKMGDRLTAIAIAYIKPDFRSLPLDVASIEANIFLDETAGVEDTDVGEVTGIALGNSAVNTPGFPGATLLASVQAFASKKARFSNGGNMESLTLDEVRQFIRAQNVLPSDLFGYESLTQDLMHQGYLDRFSKGARKEAESTLAKSEADFQKTKDELTVKIRDLEKKLGEKDVAIASSQVPSIFSKMAKDRKLSEKQTKFIEKRLKRFNPSAPDKIESELSKHLDQELDEYKETIEVLGVQDESLQKEDGKNGDGGTGPEETKNSGEMEDKYLDPAQNPMIPRL